MKPSIFLNELIVLKHMETLEKMPFNLLAYNTLIDIIFQSTGLSIEEIKKLKS